MPSRMHPTRRTHTTGRPPRRPNAGSPPAPGSGTVTDPRPCEGRRLQGTPSRRVERYTYDAYGQPAVYNASWTAITEAAGKDNALRFCGYVYDASVGLYHVRHRTYHPTLGRWLQRDPAGYVDGMSVYEYVRSSPIVFADPEGLQAGGLLGPINDTFALAKSIVGNSGDVSYDLGQSNGILFTAGKPDPKGGDWKVVRKKIRFRVRDAIDHMDLCYIKYAISFDRHADGHVGNVDVGHVESDCVWCWNMDVKVTLRPMAGNRKWKAGKGNQEDRFRAIELRANYVIKRSLPVAGEVTKDSYVSRWRILGTGNVYRILKPDSDGPGFGRINEGLVP